jgi:integrase
MPKRAWPKVQYRSRRAIKIEEHDNILAAERLPDYAIYFKLLWETGGSQSDVVNLRAENVDWSTRTLHYSRQKLATRGGGHASLAIGARLEAVLKRLPSAGHLFPRLRLLGENMRAGHFCKLCKRAGISGVSLHSYRYAWAERAYSAGMPEREAQAHLGHGSKAVHRAYAKRANVITLPLEEYEMAKSKKLLMFRDNQNSDGAELSTIPANVG